MEQTFGQVNYEKYFDDFVRRYLTMHLGLSKSILEKEIYKTFRRFHKKYKQEKNKQEKEHLLSDMYKFATYYHKIALSGNEENDKLSKAFENIRALKADISYPLLMCLYHDYKENHLQESEFIEAITLIESYIFRRHVCRLRTSDTGSAMLRMVKEYKSGGVKKIKERVMKVGGAQYFPRDTMFKSSFKSYNKHLKYWPFRLENHQRKDHISNEDYTIEHIMPQTLPHKWQKVIGPKWDETHIRCLNLPGNITLTKHNSELSDLVYHDKYHKPVVGYKYTQLNINKSLPDTDTWNQDTIDSRSEHLAEMAVACWPLPTNHT